MTLFRRGKVWWSYVWVKGVRHAKSTKTTNRRLAEEVDHNHKHELTFLREQAPQLAPDMLFSALVASFLASAGAKPWHLDRLKLLLPFFGDDPIGRITRNRAREFRQWRHKMRPLTETTVNRDLECLRHLLFWAVDEGLLISNPLARMPMERERKRKRAVISLEEEDRLLPAAAPHLRPIIIMALYAGMRRGELLNQRWEDVDFARRLLFVTHSKTPEGEAREIPLTQRLFNLLWEMRENEGLIFTYKDRPIHSIKTGWKKALMRAGIPRFRFHSLRHAFNTRLLEAGVIREVRMSLMGHSLGDDPQSTYTHVELPLKRDAIAKLEVRLELERKKLRENGEGEPYGQSEAMDHARSDRTRPQRLLRTDNENQREA
jgi:integrase